MTSCVKNKRMIRKKNKRLKERYNDYTKHKKLCVLIFWPYELHLKKHREMLKLLVEMHFCKILLWLILTNDVSENQERKSLINGEQGILLFLEILLNISVLTA